MKYSEFSDMGEDKMLVIKEVMDKAPQGYFCEVGVREGGTSAMALDHVNCGGLFSVDPWGNKPYIDNFSQVWWHYPDAMGGRAMKLLSDVALENNKLHIHHRTTSLSFLKMDYELWIESNPMQLMDIKFSYVLLDGDHTVEVVTKEIEEFSKRMVEGGVILVDNTDWIEYDFADWQQPRQDMAYKIF